jgi:hypothetical protein
MKSTHLAYVIAVAFGGRLPSADSPIRILADFAQIVLVVRSAATTSLLKRCRGYPPAPDKDIVPISYGFGESAKSPKSSERPQQVVIQNWIFKMLGALMANLRS